MCISCVSWTGKWHQRGQLTTNDFTKVHSWLGATKLLRWRQVSPSDFFFSSWEGLCPHQKVGVCPGRVGGRKWRRGSYWRPFGIASGTGPALWIWVLMLDFLLDRPGPPLGPLQWVVRRRRRRQQKGSEGASEGVGAWVETKQTDKPTNTSPLV